MADCMTAGLSSSVMERLFISEMPKRVGERVSVAGWVHTRRDHGKLVFIDLRDRSGLLQVVFRAPSEASAREGPVSYGDDPQPLRSEWVVRIEGTVKQRPENMVNPKLPTGSVELVAEKLTILSQAHTPPFELNDETVMANVEEEIRLTYRYLDLRRPDMFARLMRRHDIVRLIRGHLSDRGFLEIETPILTRSTPEGARDYLVPSRIAKGAFYALPQSPQQYKQLLMAAGVERYFQIARCFRDEDTRGDRQPEFTQLDLEMSFVEREDVMALTEELLIRIVKELFPEKTIQDIPFPRIPYREAMERYGTDRPDLRKDKNDQNLLAFTWIVDFPFFERDPKGGWTFTHNPFSAPLPEHMQALLSQEDIERIVAAQYDVVLNGWEIGGGSIRNHSAEALEAVFRIMGFSHERIQQNFGHMLRAFQFGAPPHGGIAWGFDRLVMALLNQPNIREVIAFPKTGDSRDPMMGAPNPVAEEQLQELGIRIERSAE